MVDENKWPKTVDEAVDQLVLTMSEEDKKALGNMPEKDLFLSHFGLGMYIRNEFGLWAGNEELLKSCALQIYPDSPYDGFITMFVQPDDASTEIIKATWRRLQE